MIAISARPTSWDLKRFFSKVRRDGDCWRWVGARTKKGYGLFATTNGNTSAQRFTYTWFVGEIPSGYQTDHLCRHTWCVNPAHVDAVTLQENRRRAELFRTHCRSGRHRRDATFKTHGHGKARTCAKCHVIRQQRYLQRLMEAA